MSEKKTSTAEPQQEPFEAVFLLELAHLRAAEPEKLGRWAELFVSLGRAEQAAAMGDRAQVKRWLEDVVDVEACLLGCTGPAEVALDALRLSSTMDAA